MPDKSTTKLSVPVRAESRMRDRTVRRHPLVFSNWGAYCDRFFFLLNLECDYAKTLNDAQVIEDVSIRWKTDSNGKYRICFSADSRFDNLLKPGAQLIVNLTELKESISAKVIQIPNNLLKEFELEVQTDKECLIEAAMCSINFVWNPCTFIRMRRALFTFRQNRTLCSPFRSQLLGHKDSTRMIDCNILKILDVPKLPHLDQNQESAVKSVLQNSFSLIQAPPGTGKTVTSASIVYHLKQMHPNKILVTASSNIAVDNLCEKIHKTGLKVVRLNARSREAVPSVSQLTCEWQALKQSENQELYMLHQVLKTSQLSTAEGKRYRQLLIRAEVQVLEAADVICCTCSTAADKRLESLLFDVVLIDEATQATEPEMLIALQLDCKRLILIGDHCQLGPTVLCMKAARAGLDLSLFERLVCTGVVPIIRLQIQYRMHPALSTFPNKTFYEGKLRDGISAQDRCVRFHFPWPNTEQPTFFYRITGQEEIAGDHVSYFNHAEAVAVGRILEKMSRVGIPLKTVGVIVPYDAQRAHLVRYLKKSDSRKPKFYDPVEIASVDSFQGREKDYIIFSCVRSNKKQQIGFLGDCRRLNVALTRAKYGLILVGNPETLYKDSVWNQLICFYQDRHLLMEGSLDNLKEVSHLKIKYLPPSFTGEICIDSAGVTNKMKCMDLTSTTSPATNNPQMVSKHYNDPIGVTSKMKCMDLTSTTSPVTNNPQMVSKHHNDQIEATNRMKFMDLMNPASSAIINRNSISEYRVSSIGATSEIAPIDLMSTAPSATNNPHIVSKHHTDPIGATNRMKRMDLMSNTSSTKSKSMSVLERVISFISRAFHRV